MQNILKTGILLCAAVSLLTLLSGCLFIPSAEELYALPKLPEEYTNLEAELTQLMNDGYEYAAPTEGENIQMVQMVDLDQDGTDEAVAFLRKSSQAKPLFIYIFKQKENGYEIAGVIQEGGASIARVDYEDLNGDGLREIIVGWRMTGGDAAKNQSEDKAAERALTQLVSVYSIERYSCQKVLETQYNRYVLTDLDSTGYPELITITGGSSGNCSAILYEWNLGVMEQASVAKLSMPPALLEDVSVGLLSDGVQGLFVTGSADEETLVTDLLVLKGGSLSNCLLDEQTGTSTLLYHNSSLQARDINEDGILELPIPYPLARAPGETQTYWGIRWTAFSSQGVSQIMETTFHNLTDDWYLVLPESWKDTIMVTKVVSSNGERAVTFGAAQEDGEAPLELLTIYTETGDGREYQAGKGKRFILVRQATIIYAAEFLPDYAAWPGAMSRDALEDGFYVIHGEWYLK